MKKEGEHKVGMVIFWIVLIFIGIVVIAWFADTITNHFFNCYVSNSTFEGYVCKWK